MNSIQPESLLEGRRLLDHPFYRRWEEGTLSAEGLRDYAIQYYFVERSLTQMATGPEWEDEARHPELWLRFAEALGLDRSEVTEAAMRPATKALVEMNDQAKQSDESRVGALYAYEVQAAAIARVKQDSLSAQYGVHSGLEFFDAHAGVEDDHAAAGRKLVDQGGLESLSAMDAALDAHWTFLTQALDVDDSTR